MNDTLQSQFTAEYMAASFPDISKLQEFLRLMTYDRARKMTRHFSTMADLKKNQSDSLLLNRKHELETDIAALKNGIKAGNPKAPIVAEMKHELYMKQREVKGIEEKLAKFSFFENSRGWVNIKEIEHTIQAIDQLAYHVIDWFKEGPLGPGTVEYNSVQYTVK